MIVTGSTGASSKVGGALLQQSTQDIQLYPFKDLTFDKGIKLITESRELEGEGNVPEAIKKLEQAIETLVIICERDYSSFLKECLPNGSKELKESLAKAKATQVAASDNIGKCRKAIVSLQSTDAEYYVCAGILAEIFSLEDLENLENNTKGNPKTEKVFNELGVASEIVRQRVITLAKEASLAAKRYDDIATPDDYQTLQKYGMRGNKVTYRGERVSSWKTRLKQLSFSKGENQSERVVDNSGARNVLEARAQLVTSKYPIQQLLDEINNPEEVQEGLSESDVDREIQKYLPNDEQASCLIKALAKNGVIVSIEEVRGLTLLISNEDFVLKDSEDELEQINPELVSILSGPKLEGAIGTHGTCRLLCDFLRSTKIFKFGEWYLEKTKIYVKDSFAAGPKVYRKVTGEEDRKRILKLIDLAYARNNISGAEREVLIDLVQENISFKQALSKLNSVDEKLIMERICDIANRLEKGYLGIKSRITRNILKQRESSLTQLPSPSKSLDNLSFWLGLSNEDILKYLCGKYPALQF